MHYELKKVLKKKSKILKLKIELQKSQSIMIPFTSTASASQKKKSSLQKATAIISFSNLPTISTEKVFQNHLRWVIFWLITITTVAK